MTITEKTVQRLKESIKQLKSKVSTTRALQKKKDLLDQKYNDSQYKFKTVFEQSSLGQKFINSDLKIVKVNNALVKLLGYTKKELLGMRIMDIAVPEFKESWTELQFELWTNKKSSFSIDTCIFKKDRSIVWCHISSILLEDNGETLGYTILEDVTLRKEMESTLNEANDREKLFQQQLLEMTLNTQEKERARIADDLHNSLGQILFGVGMSLDHIKLDRSDYHSENIENIKNSKKLLYKCINECRRISHDLMPSVLEDFGLQDAIEGICSQLNEKIELTCKFKGLDNRLPKYLEIAVFRIIQELAMNLVKHAEATKASLTVGIDQKDISVVIEDNGKGFTKTSIEEGDGIGIRSIKTKLQLLRGELFIDSKPGNGTIINIRLPLKVASLN
jgi:PAS domain S-box-containing protein